MSEVSPRAHLFVRPSVDGWDLYHNVTGEFAPLGPLKQKLMEDDGEMYVVELGSGSREFCDNILQHGLFEVDGNQYMQIGGKVLWVKEALKKITTRSVSFMHRIADKSFLTQEFAVGHDGRHKFWFMNNFEVC